MKSIFDPGLASLTRAHARIARNYELMHVMVDFLAAAMFVAGSVFFFFPESATLATWLFLIGSILFGVKPTIRLARAVHLSRLPATE